MGATPRAVLDYLDLVFRRMLLEVLPVVRQSGYALVLDVLEGISQCHVAVRMMMSVGFAIRSDVHQLRPDRLASTEVHQLARQRSASPSCIGNVIDHRPRGVTVGQHVSQQLAVAKNDSQAIVEIVRDTAGEPFQRFHAAGTSNGRVRPAVSLRLRPRVRRYPQYVRRDHGRPLRAFRRGQSAPLL